MLQKIKIWKISNPYVIIKEFLKDEKISLILTSKLNKGFASISKTKTPDSFKTGRRAKIELTNPTKLKIPINGTTNIFAKILNGVKLLK